MQQRVIAISIVRGMVVAMLPFAIYISLEHLQARVVTLLLVTILILRAPAASARWLHARGWLAVPLVLLAVLAAIALWWANDPAWALAYPVIINAIMLVVFATSLLHPPSVIERIARLRMPDLPPQGVAYTRRVTLVWCAFFVVNGTMAAWTALTASREAWVLYNGLIAYLLMASLFGGEWLYRRWRFGPEASATGAVASAAGCAPATPVKPQERSV